MRRALTAVLALALAFAVTGCAKAKADEGGFENVSDTMHEAALKAEPKQEPKPEQEADPQEEEAEPEEEVYEEAYEEPAYEEPEYYGPACYEPDYSAYNADGPSHTMPGYYDGHVETYYNASGHFMAGEWTLDDEGFYRDSDGRYVIGVGVDDMDSMPYGTVVQTGRGEAVVYDYGTATGVHDFATNW